MLPTLPALRRSAPATQARADAAQRTRTIARARRYLTKTGYITNGVGASVVVGFMLWLAPSTVSHEQVRTITERSIPLFIIFMLVSLPGGNYLIERRPLAQVERLLTGPDPATDEQRATVLCFSRRWASQSFLIWVTGAIVFATVNASVDVGAALDGAMIIVLGGLTACSLQYVLVDRIMRPVNALALADGVPSGTKSPGVSSRIAVVWLLTSGVPLIGVAVFAVLGLINQRIDREKVVATALFLAIVGLSIGLVTMVLVLRSVAVPLESMRDAFAAVEGGRLGTQVAVDDGSEIGMLQAGFNRMSAGLVEREQLRDAFGSYVDPSLTERVLREGADLSGQEVDLSVLFLDVRDFTAYAETATPHEVVARLNDLYSVVVPIIIRHHGHANKFVGDGLLAVFGAPDRVPEHAHCAVQAALEIVREVTARHGAALRIGIGVNSGPAVVGTIGGGGRLDFTAIGDTVNTASRVESATRETGDDILITEATLCQLGDDRAAWAERPPITLRGKERQVKLYALVAAGPRT